MLHNPSQFYREARAHQTYDIINQYCKSAPSARKITTKKISKFGKIPHGWVKRGVKELQTAGIVRWVTPYTAFRYQGPISPDERTLRIRAAAKWRIVTYHANSKSFTKGRSHATRRR